jgi:natural product precursor
MKNLKLNQLSKQKVAEKEMNFIKGGALPGTGYDDRYRWDWDKCGQQCNTYDYPVSYQGFVNGQHDFV